MPTPLTAKAAPPQMPARMPPTNSAPASEIKPPKGVGEFWRVKRVEFTTSLIEVGERRATGYTPKLGTRILDIEAHIGVMGVRWRSLDGVDRLVPWSQVKFIDLLDQLE